MNSVYSEFSVTIDGVKHVLSSNNVQAFVNGILYIYIQLYYKIENNSKPSLKIKGAKINWNVDYNYTITGSDNIPFLDEVKDYNDLMTLIAEILDIDKDDMEDESIKRYVGILHIDEEQYTGFHDKDESRDILFTCNKRDFILGMEWAVDNLEAIEIDGYKISISVGHVLDTKNYEIVNIE